MSSSSAARSGARITPALPAARALRGAAVRRWSVAALVLIVAVALALRVVAYEKTPRSYDGAGLAAEQGEMARNALDHGKWFALNVQAFNLLKARQAKENRLVDLSRVDFSVVDREARPTPVVDQMPGVAVVLTGLWWVSGNKSYAQIQWLQILLDSVLTIVVFWIAFKLTRRRSIGLIAAAGYAVSPWGIHFTILPVLDTWAVYFTVLCVAAFVWARDRPESRRRLILLGVVTGIGIYFRPFVVLLPVALAAVAAPAGWRRKLAWAAIPTAVALAILAPWTIRNYYDFHRFIPTRTGLGQALFEGNSQAATDEESQAYVRQQKTGAGYGTPGYDQTLLHGATRSILDHPGTYLRRVGGRSWLLLPCLLALFAWRRWRTEALVLVAAAAATIVPYLFIGSDRRFDLPAVFAYLTLGAMAIYVVCVRLLKIARPSA